MRKSLNVALAVTALVTASMSMADEVNGIQYNSIDLAYGSGSLEGGSGASRLVFDRFSGMGINATYRADNFLISGTYQSAKSDGVTSNGVATNIKTELKVTTLGLGYRFAISPGFDLVPSVTHTSQKTTLKRSGVADSSTNNSGNSIDLTAYNKLTESLQSNVGFSRNSSEENTISAGLLFKLNKNWGLRAGYSHSTGADSLKSSQTTVGVSYLY